MLYTEEVKRRYITSGDQHVRISDKAELRREYRMSRDIQKGSMSKGGQVIAAVIALAITVFIIFMVIYNFTGQTETMAKIGEAMMFVFPYGIACVISFMMLKKKISTYTVYDPARNVFSCILFGLAAIAVIPASLLIKNATVYFLFAVPGLYFTAAFFFRITERVRMYKKPVEARCTGYSRRIAYSYKTGTSCFVSPVWEYEMNGEHFSSVYDRYDWKWNSEVEIDSTKTIYCRRDDPASIISPRIGFSFIFIIVGIILLGISTFNNI